MSIDIFGRQLASKKNFKRLGSRGPPGKGYKTTTDGQYDIDNKRLCNIADPQEANDAISLKRVTDITQQSLEVLERALLKAFAQSMLQAVHAFESKLNARIDQEHTNHIEEGQPIWTLATKKIEALTKDNEVLEMLVAGVESDLGRFSQNGILRGIRFKSDWIIQQ